MKMTIGYRFSEALNHNKLITIILATTFVIWQSCFVFPSATVDSPTHNCWYAASDFTLNPHLNLISTLFRGLALFIRLAFIADFACRACKFIHHFSCKLTARSCCGKRSACLRVSFNCQKSERKQKKSCETDWKTLFFVILCPPPLFAFGKSWRMFRGSVTLSYVVTSADLNL